MRNKIKVQISLLLVLLASVTILFQVKNNIRITERQLRTEKSNLIKAEKNKVILEAENTYLRSPEKIHKLVKENLKLRLITSEDIIDIVNLKEINGGHSQYN